jgi:hypothetical protein
MATQRRFYLVLLNDGAGARAQGPYTKSEARTRQIANVGARIVTGAQLALMRERAQAKPNGGAR